MKEQILIFSRTYFCGLYYLILSLNMSEFIFQVWYCHEFYHDIHSESCLFGLVVLCDQPTNVRYSISRKNMATRSFPLLCQCCISIYQCLQRLGLGRNDCCQPMYMFTETKLGRTISYKNQFSPRMHPDLDLRIFYIGAIIH